MEYVSNLMKKLSCNEGPAPETTDYEEDEGGIQRSKNHIWTKQLPTLTGSGTYGQVLKGHNTATGEFVAIKVIGNGGPDQRIHWASLNKLESDFLLRHIAMEEVEGSPNKAALVMELWEGTVGDELKKPEYYFGLPYPMLFTLIDNFVEGFSYLQAQKMGYRDVKPDNILVFRCPRLHFKLCDFGLSGLKPSGEGLVEPEPCTSKEGTKAAAERFALQRFAMHGTEYLCSASTIYQCATGRPPFASQYGKTSLQAAAFSGRFEFIKLLVQNGAEVTEADANGVTALHYVSMHKDTDSAEYLLDKGADVNAKSVSGLTPLMFAAWKGNDATARMLIEYGADVNSADEEGLTALHIAALYGNSAVVDLLLKSHINSEVRSRQGISPLHCAAYEGNVAAVCILLQFGADGNVETTDGYTPLDYSVRRCKTDVAIELGKHGAHGIVPHRNAIERMKKKAHGRLENMLSLTSLGTWKMKLESQHEECQYRYHYNRLQDAFFATMPLQHVSYSRHLREILRRYFQKLFDTPERDMGFEYFYRTCKELTSLKSVKFSNVSTLCIDEYFDTRNSKLFDRASFVEEMTEEFQKVSEEKFDSKKDRQIQITKGFGAYDGKTFIQPTAGNSGNNGDRLFAWESRDCNVVVYAPEYSLMSKDFRSLTEIVSMEEARKAAEKTVALIIRIRKERCLLRKFFNAVVSYIHNWQEALWPRCAGLDDESNILAEVEIRSGVVELLHDMSGTGSIEPDDSTTIRYTSGLSREFGLNSLSQTLREMELLLDDKQRHVDLPSRHEVFKLKCAVIENEYKEAWDSLMATKEFVCENVRALLGSLLPELHNLSERLEQASWLTPELFEESMEEIHGE